MELNLFETFQTDTLRHRETAQIILDMIRQIPENAEVIINFDKIIFVSRSFCHELLSNLKCRKNVSYKNKNQEIEQMMSLVFTKPHVNFNTLIRKENIKLTPIIA